MIMGNRTRGKILPRFAHSACVTSLDKLNLRYFLDVRGVLDSRHQQGEDLPNPVKTLHLFASVGYDAMQGREEDERIFGRVTT